jgi:hypothetical protein
MTLDWILAVGTVVFAFTTWATLNFGYAYFRELGRRDDEAAQRMASGSPEGPPAGPPVIDLAGSETAPDATAR